MNHAKSFKFHGSTFNLSKDGQRLTNNVQRVFALMLDGQWHSPEELRKVGGANWGARVRSLREPQMGSLIIQRRRENNHGAWSYRLDTSSVKESDVQKILDWNIAPKKKETKDPTHRCCPVCSGTGKLPISNDDKQLRMFSQ